jgi:glycosyltransferase involved in cell wall biosynthesis
MPAMQQQPHNPRLSVFLMINSLETGGSERQFAALVDSLDRKRFHVELGCIGNAGRFRDGLGEITHVPPGGNLYGLQSWRSRMVLARRLRSHRTAVAHSFDFYSNLMLIPAARFARAPVVIGSHRQLGDLLGPWRLAVQIAAFRLCDRVVCNSRAAAQSLIQHGLPARKIVVILNGLPDEAFADTAPLLPRQSGALRVGMVARMNNPVKNYPGLLHAAARLAPKFPTLEFLLVGDGPLRPELQKMARSLGIEDRVRFLGDRGDISAILASLDISVLPSLSESLSNSVLESMAAGLPVVATRVGGNRELVRDGETGYLVPPNDEISLAEALERLLNDPTLRSAFGKRAREIARADFGLGRVAEQYEKLYTSLLARKRWKPHAYRVPGAPAETRPAVRVAIVAPTLRYVGGQAVQADLLLKHWQCDPQVGARLIPIDPELPAAMAWTQRIRYARTLARIPFYWLALWRGLREVDVAHIFSASYWAFLLAPAPALLLARLRGKKTLINYHSGEARDHLARWRTALPILRQADRLVVPSMYLAGVFRDFGLDADVVPNVVDLTQFRYRPRNPLRARLLCSRGFGAYYRVDLVVRAFARVQQEFPDARLCLLGEGEQEAHIRALARQLQLANVDFPGNIGRGKIAQYYDDADIFVNASWLDNMPLSILEAFASGTPVASTAPEGIKYLVEHERTGLLSELGDWEGLARSVLRILRDPDFGRTLADRGFQEVQRYSWEAVRGQWLKVYTDLLHNGACARESRGTPRESSVLSPNPQPELESSSLARLSRQGGRGVKDPVIR